MIQFILNQKSISTEQPVGTTLLDFIRYNQNLTGTKIGCREGDCGACTILVGSIKNGELVYQSATSCLMPIGNAQGKHIVTIEGVNTEGLNFIQQAFSDEGATQCGFCTPGFIVSLAGYCINKNIPSTIDAINGNICRCTGYKSIERAAQKIENKLTERKGKDAIAFAVENNILPNYFLQIKERLTSVSQNIGTIENKNNLKNVGGGTDLYVQQHDTMVHSPINFLNNISALNGIVQEGNKCFIGASVTVTDIAESPLFKQYFPNLQQYLKLISSTQIRNMATVAGNFVNASPIGDLSIFFLALNAQLILNNGQSTREIALNKLYKGYKVLDKLPNEIVEKIYFELPSLNTKFNFEKVCKRTHLDIASVNTAICITVDNDVIQSASLSAGGVGPIPSYLSKSSNFLLNKKIDENMVEQLLEIVQSEIAPISDARGTEAYKRLLLNQLIKAHFITLFSGLGLDKLIKA